MTAPTQHFPPDHAINDSSHPDNEGPTSTDSALLAAFVADRDLTAFSKLAARHTEWLFAAARRRLDDDHLAEDARQGVLMLLADKAAELKLSGHQSIAAWLFHALHFTCSRLRRDERRNVARVSAASQHQSGATPAPSRELVLILEDAIALLPAADRDLVVRRFYQRQSYVEIAAARAAVDRDSPTPNALRKKLGRILATLQGHLLYAGIQTLAEPFLDALDQDELAELHTDVVPLALRPPENLMTQYFAQQPSGFQLLSTEFLVTSVEGNVAFFEKLGFKPRFFDSPDTDGKLPRASMTAGTSKIWIAEALHLRRSIRPRASMYFSGSTVSRMP